MNFKIVAILILLLIIVLVIILSTNTKESYTFSTDNSLIGLDNIDFFNPVGNTDNIISRKRINDVRQELKIGVYTVKLNDNGYIVLMKSIPYLSDVAFVVSSINPVYSAKKYDNHFVYLRSNGELQVIGIINSSRTVDVLWFDKTLVKTGTPKLTLEADGNVNIYFNNTSPLNIININDIYMPNRLTSQPNNLTQLLTTKNRDEVNLLGTDSTYARKSAILDQGYTLNFDSSGNLVFGNLTSKKTIIANTLTTKRVGASYLLVLVEDETGQLDFRTYEIYNNKPILIKSIDLKTLNIEGKTINPANYSSSDPKTIPLWALFKKPFSLVINKNTLFLSGINKYTGQRLNVPLASV
jgi:hypothetical protein